MSKWCILLGRQCTLQWFLQQKFVPKGMQYMHQLQMSNQLSSLHKRRIQ